MASRRRSRAAGVRSAQLTVRPSAGRDRRWPPDARSPRPARPGRAEHFGVVEQVEHPQDERLGVGHRQPHHHRAVVARARPPPPGPARRPPGPTRPRRPARPPRPPRPSRTATGRGRRPASTSKSVGTRADAGSPTSGRPSIRSTRKVRASPRSRSNPIRYQWPSRNRSPATSTWRRARPGSRTRTTAPWRTASNSSGQGRQPVHGAQIDQRRGAAVRSGDSPPAPSFNRASRPIGSPRWTPATARFKAACSSASRPRSGR